MAQRRNSDFLYDAFISYSHSLDDMAAGTFQRGIEHFGRPWYRSRELRVFRDTENLSASPGLWLDIQRALEGSAWLIFMASPAAATSPWVRKEIEWWLENRGSDRILIAWTDGTIAWDETAKTFKWPDSDALPEAELCRAFPAEPRWVNLRWLREHHDVPLSDPRLLSGVAEFVAPIRGKSKDELIGDHLRRRRMTRRVVGAVITGLVTLLCGAILMGVLAVQQRDTASRRQLTATSRQLVAEATSIQSTQPELARQLLVQAYRMSPTAQAAGALIGSTAIPRVIQTGSPARGISFDPRGRILASATNKGVVLYDTPTAKVLVRLEQTEYTTALAFNRDGKLLAVGDKDGLVQLWNVASPADPHLLGTATTTGDSIMGLAFSNQAPLLVVGIDAAQTGVIDIRDVRRPRLIESMPPIALAGLSEGLAVSTDGKTVAASGEEGTVRMMSLSASGRLTVLKTLKSPSSVLAFSPKGNFLAAAGSDYTGRLWDTTDPSRPKQLTVLNGQSLGFDALAFSADGDTLATGAGDNTIQLWDISDPVRPRQGSLLTGHTYSVTSLAFAPDRGTLASAGADGATRAEKGADSTNGTLRLWNVDGAQSSSARTSVPSGHISPQAFDPKGQILTGGSPSTLWWVARGSQPRRLATLPTFNQGGQWVSYSPDGRTLAAGSPLTLWDADDPLRPTKRPGGRPMTDGSQVVIFNSAGSLAAAGDGNGGIQLWELQKRSPVARAKLPSSGHGDLAFLADGSALAVAAPDDDAVQIWDVTEPSKPTLTGTIKQGPARLSALAASRDGSTLLTGNSYGQVTLWDVRDPRNVVRRGSAERHAGSVAGVAIHPEGRIAASTDDEGSMRIWDITDPAQPRETAALTLSGPLGATGLAFSPDGSTLAAAGTDRTLLWDMDLTGIQQRLCSESQRITRSQWAQYLPDRAYDPPCAGK